MLPARTYEEVCTSLTEYMNRKRDVRLVGLVFCQPHSSFAKNEILPALPYFDDRSGERVNFYFAGYCKKIEVQVNNIVGVPLVDFPDWAFSAKAFNDFRQNLERKTAWKYSGATDFILANARYESERGKAFLDFSSAISITLEKLEHDGSLTNVGMLFERVFSYAETCTGDDPTWGFSDQEGKKIVGGALKNLVVSVLPKSIQQGAKDAIHFVSNDLS